MSALLASAESLEPLDVLAAERWLLRDDVDGRLRPGECECEWSC